MQLRKIREMKDKLSVEQKKRLLVSLRKIHGSGETQVNEDEYTANVKSAPKVVAKTFDTEADFDSYVSQRRGIEMTPKELQALSVMTEQMASAPQQPQTQPVQPSAPRQKPSNPQPVQKPKAPQEDEQDVTSDDKIRVQKSQPFFDDIHGADILADFLAEIDLTKEKPTRGDKFHLKYELTDDFGNNTTTIVKKLKEGNQFCWTAFSKYETAEEEGNPNKGADGGGED